jgi:hypothetical protein
LTSNCGEFAITKVRAHSFSSEAYFAFGIYDTLFGGVLRELRGRVARRRLLEKVSKRRARIAGVNRLIISLSVVSAAEASEHAARVY